MNPPSLFYFPLNIALVDDNKNYLELTKAKITDNKVIEFDNSINAINLIKPISINPLYFIKEYLSGEYTLNYQKIADFVNGYSVNKESGILIVDYAMPELNGIDLCKKYINDNIIKILLTGEYDHTNALNSLNNKEIDYYVSKNCDSKITNAIYSTQNKFFSSLSNNIKEIIGNTEIIFLKDANYISIFNEAINSKNITKYYIFNEYGGYILFSQDSRYILTIYHQDQLLELYQEYHVTSPNNEVIPSYNLLEGSLEFLPARKFGEYFYNLSIDE